MSEGVRSATPHAPIEIVTRPLGPLTARPRTTGPQLLLKTASAELQERGMQNRMFCTELTSSARIGMPANIRRSDSYPNDRKGSTAIAGKAESASEYSVPYIDIHPAGTLFPARGERAGCRLHRSWRSRPGSAAVPAEEARRPAMAQRQISRRRGDRAGCYLRCRADRMVTLVPRSPWLATSVRPSRR